MDYSIIDRKNFPIATGVYIIRFKEQNSDKVYVGSASMKNNGFKNRWNRHIYSLRKNNVYTHLQMAYNKYGEDNMVFSIVEECDLSLCVKREQFYINKYNSYENGYNSRPIANSNLGFKQSNSQKNKIVDKFRKIRDQKFNEINTLYKNGKTTREISKLLKISRSLTERTLKENNIKMRILSSYRKRPIFQYNLDGSFIKEWDSGKSCSDSLKINSNSIRLTLKEICSNAKGYFFSYQKQNKLEILNIISKIKESNKNRKQDIYYKYFNVKQIDDSGNIIKIWENLTDIVNFLNIKNRKKISESIDNGLKYRNFYWSMV